MNEFSVFTNEELIDEAYSTRDAFFALHDSDDLSDECIAEMASHVERLESLQAEADRRITLAAKLEALNAKVQQFSTEVK